jgi:hypothetical protein
MIMSTTDPQFVAEGEAAGEINLRPLIRANESGIRYYVETLLGERMSRAIGRENLGKIRLIFRGSPFDDLMVYVEGPDDLKAKVEEAFRKP